MTMMETGKLLNQKQFIFPMTKNTRIEKLIGGEIYFSSFLSKKEKTHFILLDYYPVRSEYNVALLKLCDVATVRQHYLIMNFDYWRNALYSREDYFEFHEDGTASCKISAMTGESSLDTIYYLAEEVV